MHGRQDQGQRYAVGIKCLDVALGEFGKFLDDRGKWVVFEVFEHRREIFEVEGDHDVRSHAKGDFEEDGMGIPGPGVGHIKDVPRPADIDGQGQHSGGISEDAGQQGGAHQRVIAMASKHVSQHGQGVAARSQRGQRGHVEVLEQAPGIAVVHGAHSAQSSDFAPGAKRHGQYSQAGHRPKSSGQNRRGDAQEAAPVDPRARATRS